MTDSKRIIKYERHYRMEAPLRFVTTDEIEFMEKVFNREDGLHKMNLSLRWKPVLGLKELMVEFYTDEGIPVNRFANVYQRENENEPWECVASGDGTWVSEIVFWVETYYQEALGLAHWDYIFADDQRRHSVLKSTTPEYFLGLDKEEQLKWGEFFLDRYRSRMTREVIGITDEHIRQLNDVSCLIGG